MSKIFKSYDKSEFYINNLFELNIDIHNIKITESLFGDIPTIELQFNCDPDDLKDYKINKVLTGTLTSPDGFTNTINGFIYKLTLDLNEVTMGIMNCDPEFTKNKVVSKYLKIDNAVDSTWKRGRYIERKRPQVKTDINFADDGLHSIYQRMESNYTFCNRLCRSYKHNTVYGFLFDGLRFLDLDNLGTEECEVHDQSGWKLMNPPQWSDSKFYDNDVDYIDYNHKSPEYELDPNHTIVSLYGRQVVVDSIYKELVGNFLYNDRLSHSKQVANFKCHYLDKVQVGDYFKLKSKQIEFNDVFLSKRIIEFRESSTEVSYEVRSIKPWS
jgi:hypothetical protein